MKFNNKRIGKYRSLFEKEINKQLRSRNRAKVSYESHSISYSIPRVYNPDFTIVLPSGQTFYVECKGYFRPEDKLKMKYVKICNPTLDIRIIFPRRNKKDLSWCEKHGFPSTVGTIPRSWLNG